MYRSQKILQHFFLMVIIFLPGCGARIMDWAKGNFYQGEEVVPYNSVPSPYVRSVKIYSEFSTRAIFDALWLSDEVRTEYAKAYSARVGKSTELEKAFLRRQLEENNHFISFYLLASYQIPLNDSASPWSLMLKVGDTFLAPLEISAVDLAPEFKYFFNKRFNRFKTAYLVKFSAKDAQGNSLMSPMPESITLQFRSYEKDAALTWHIRKKIQKGDYENSNWC